MVANPIITISRATSSSTRAIAEKNNISIILINLEISEALGISSLCKDLNIDFSARKDNKYPDPKIVTILIFVVSTKCPLLKRSDNIVNFHAIKRISKKK